MRLFFILTILFSSISFGQTKEKSKPKHYDYPLESYYQPLQIRVNAVLLYKDDGSGNFNLNDPEERDVFHETLEKNNFVFSNFEKLPDKKNCYDGDDFIDDAKIRFNFNIIKVNNTFYWNYLNSGARPEEKKFIGLSPSEKWYIKPLDDSINSSDKPKAINMYFTENGERFDDLYKKKGEGYDVARNMAAQFPTTVDLNRSSQVHIPNQYVTYLFQRYQSPKNYNTTWEKTRHWLISTGIAHELGHNFGLGHSNEYYKTNACHYTLMNQSHKSPRNWLPPTEIKKIHYNLSRTNMMQFVTPESAYGATWYLKEDTNWNEPRRFYHNFDLAKNTTLTISDVIILPPQSYIKLNKGSKIIFKGKGKIVNAYGKEYKNFQKHRTAKIVRQS